MPSLGDARPFVPDHIWIPDQDVPCGAHADLFTSSKMGRLPIGELNYMRRLCLEECPLTQECLDSALREEGDAMAAERGGMRGGCTPKERRRINVRRRKK